MAIYEVTYKDENGGAIYKGTFHADTPKEGLQILVSTPSLAPPPGTETIEVKLIPPAT